MTKQQLDEVYLDKRDLARRLRVSKSTVDTWCSRAPHRLPKFFRLGDTSHGTIRWRLREVIEFEQRQLDLQQQRQSKRVENLSDLLDD